MRSKKACHAGTPLAYTRRVRRYLLLVLLAGCALLSTTVDVRSEGLAPSRTRFYYRNFDGTRGSARIIRHYWKVPVVHPDAAVDPRRDDCPGTRQCPLQIALLAICKAGPSRLGRDQFVSQDQLRFAGR